MLFFFFLMTDIYFLIFGIIAQIVNPVVELIILAGILTKEVEAETQIHPVTKKGNVHKPI